MFVFRCQAMEQENVCWSSSEVERLVEQIKNEIQADEKKDVAIAAG